MDGTEDDLFNDDDEGDDSFDGFDERDVKDAQQYNDNVQAEHIHEMELDTDSDVDSVHQDDYECDPGSPGK